MIIENGNGVDFMGEIEERVYVCEPADKANLKKVLDADPYAKDSFARKAPQMKEVDNKAYVYIKAESEFFTSAEEKFKEIPSMKRAEKVDEQRIVDIIHKEEDEAAGGFGNIFG
jgi:hypothetical protein